MKILGIDPSTVATGWGFLRFEDGRFTDAQSGVLRGLHGDHRDDRLLQMFDGLQSVIAVVEPDIVCIEVPFAGRNMKTAMALAQVDGAAVIAARRARIRVQHYSVPEIKVAVTSYGGSDKAAVARAVAAILGDADQTIQSDQADALAVAICHAHRLDEAAIITAARP